MMQTSFANSRQPALSNVVTSKGFLTWQQLMLAAVAGIASAAIGQLLGRPAYFAWQIPTSGSLLVALPRAIILLAVLVRINRFGALTTAGVAEVGTRLAIGSFGLLPMCLLVPVVANLAGDILWSALRRLPGRRMMVMLTGGALCGARVLAALLFWSLLGLSISRPTTHLPAILGLIIVINIVLGIAAGFLVTSGMKILRR